MKSVEENLISEYFDAFNRHDIDGVMTCFSKDVAVVGAEGRVEGQEAVREHYEREFKVVPDGRCDLRTAAANNGHGFAESLFHGKLRDGQPIKALGAEVFEFSDGKISEIRDYHRPVESHPTDTQRSPSR